MHALTPMFDRLDIPPQQRLQYLQSLSSDQMHDLVKETHDILDNDMKKDGTITPETSDPMPAWHADTFSVRQMRGPCAVCSA